MKLLASLDLRPRMTFFALLFFASASGAETASTGVSRGSAAVQCLALFSAPVVEFPIQWTPSYPKRMKPVLSDSQLLEIFRNVEMFSREHGRRALAYMKALPKGLDSETRAHIWMEMSVFIVMSNRTAFVSDLYILPGRRYLFRGGLGETLFIDADGTTYRTKTENLYDQKTWVADYSTLAPL